MAPRGRPPGKRSFTSRPSANQAPDDSSPSSAKVPTPTTQVSPENSAITTATTTTTPVRPPVQRLDTLRKPVYATASASSSSTEAAIPGEGQAKKPLRAKPRFIARRSKEERDAIAAVERERAKERSAAAEAAARLAGAASGPNVSRGQRDRGRAGRGGRGRGGYMGIDSGAGTGAFSSGMGVGGASRRMHGAVRARLRREPDSQVRSQGVSIKREGTTKADEDGDFSMLGIKVKKEQFESGDMSSDQEDEEEGPKQDIDYINLVSSSDEEQPAANDRPSAPRSRMKSPTLAPIRIQRREHVSQEATVKLESGERSRPGQDTSRKNKPQVSTGRKGKTRAKDVEVVKSESTWKGVYVDDGDDGHQVRIKSEVQDDDTIAVDDIPEKIPETELLPEGEEKDGEEALKEPLPLRSSSSPEKDKKDGSKTVKHRYRKHSFRDTKGMMHTVEDRQEWTRHQESLKVLREELGQLDIGQPTIDAEGDVRMGETSSSNQDKKSDRVYLFQFPSVMPGLTKAPEDGEPASQANNTTASQNPAGVAGTQAEPGPEPGATTSESAPDQENVKVEEDDDKDTSSSKDRPSLWPPMEPGKVGKLRVHESGRATLSWGGTSFEIAMGTDAHFLQDVVLARLPQQQPDGHELSREGNGVAMAMGQIRGKFVVTPDWSDIVG